MSVTTPTPTPSAALEALRAGFQAMDDQAHLDDLHAAEDGLVLLRGHGILATTRRR